jgi:hypothetical protein
VPPYAADDRPRTNVRSCGFATVKSATTPCEQYRLTVTLDRGPLLADCTLTGAAWCAQHTLLDAELMAEIGRVVLHAVPEG